MATTTASKSKSANRSTTDRVRDAASSPNGLAIGAAAAGLVAGLAANFVRKAVVQAPTMLAGQWDEALKTEHRMVEAIFDKLEQTDESQVAKRNTLLTQMKHALAKHALQEENVVYASMRDHAQKDEADKLNHEHGYVKQYLFDLTQMPKDSPAWIGKVREFRKLIDEHVQDEETRLFPALKRQLSEEENQQLTVAMNKEGLKIA
jgi:hemerythrin superfamily protein